MCTHEHVNYSLRLSTEKKKKLKPEFSLLGLVPQPSLSHLNRVPRHLSLPFVRCWGITQSLLYARQGLYHGVTSPTP